MGKKQRTFGATAIFLGLSDFGIECLDSWARWDMVSHFPHLGWIASPFVAPVLIFVGMLLTIRGREREHLVEMESCRQKPILVGPDSLPALSEFSSWDWRKELLLIPLAAFLAILVAGTMLWFYTPPVPAPVFGPPPVDPLAYKDWDAPMKQQTGLGPVIRTGPIAPTGPCAITQVGGQGNSAISNCGALARTISGATATRFRTELGTETTRVAVWESTSDGDDFPFAAQIYDELQRAGWTMDGDKPVAMIQTEVARVDVGIFVHGDPVKAAGESIEMPKATFNLIMALKAAGFVVDANRSPKVEEGLTKVVVYPRLSIKPE